MKPEYISIYWIFFKSVIFKLEIQYNIVFMRSNIENQLNLIHFTLFHTYLNSVKVLTV